MSKILIAVLIVAVVALAGVLVWQNWSQPAPIVNNRQLVSSSVINQPATNQFQENKQCLAEGEKDYVHEYKASINEYGYMCCSGLTPLDGGEYLGADGVCYPGGGDMRILCTKCGNGICGLGENKCNCPQDCQ